VEEKSSQSAPTTPQFSSSSVSTSLGFHLLASNSDRGEEYLTARGYNGVNTTQMSDWRRDHMSNLVNAFDFENVSYITAFSIG
jgi:hypothetical protein